jgi:hypothetical protein
LTEDEKKQQREEALKKWNEDSDQEEDNVEENKNVQEEEVPGKFSSKLKQKQNLCFC